MDPEEQKKKQIATPTDAIFTSLEQESSSLGSTITRVPILDTIEKVVEGPANPVILVHRTGHLYVLFGAIQVNGNLLCQVVHGDEAVSVLPKQVLLEGGFQEAWRLERKKGAAVPIHFGSATVEIDKLWHNFGEFLPDKPLECAFRLNNVGTQAVVLGKPVVSCQCTVSDLGDKTILASGETVDLKVVTKATGSTSLRNTIGLALYEKWSGASRQVSLALIGSQRESMEVNPRMLDFGVIVPGKVCSRTVSLREKPTDRFVLKEVDSGGIPIVHRTETVRDSDGLASYRVTLDLKVDDGWSGEYKEALTLTTDSHVRPKVNIPVIFRVEPLIRAIPSVISLGTIAVGEPREERVQLVSENGDPIDVQVDSKPEECSITLNQKKNAPEMIVAFGLGKPGIWQDIIRVRVRCTSQEYMLAIRCVGYVQEKSK